MKIAGPSCFCRLSILSLLIVLSTSVIIKVSSFQPGSNVNTTGSDSLNTYSEHVRDSTPKKLIPTHLKLCATSTIKLSQGSIGIPTFFAFPEGKFNYTLRNYSINHNDVFHTCGNGEEPTSNVTTSMPVAEYELYLSEFGTPIYFVREVTFLLANGYLSVGNAGKIIYYAPGEFCIHAIQEQGEYLMVDFKTCSISKDRPILQKCCPLGTILGDRSCEGFAYTVEEAWYPEYLDSKTLKPVPLPSSKPVFVSNKLGCNQSHEVWEWDGCHLEFHPVTDNSAVYIGAYRTWEHLSPPNVRFCFDLNKKENSTGVNKVIVICSEDQADKNEDEEKTRISYVYMSTMYVGAFFHLLTTLVYTITWPKQNIHGRTLCSCTLCLFFMQLLMGTAHLLGLLRNKGKTVECIANAIGAQYFMIGAFTWLVVVNIDLWWTFRSLRADSTKGFKRFIGYSTLGWGFPLLVTAVSVILNFKYKCRNSGIPIPEYGERYCFVTPWAQGYFVYYILSVLIAVSFVFSAITLVGLYNFKKDANNLRSSKRAEDKQTVVLFLKLSVVMGLTWVFEVISWGATKEEETNHWIWIVFDMYNALSAILIFIIFVCKKTTLTSLEQTIPKLKGLAEALSRITKPFTGETSYDNTNSTAMSANGNTVPSAAQQIKANKKSYDTVTYTKDGNVNGGFN